MGGRGRNGLAAILVAAALPTAGLAGAAQGVGAAPDGCCIRSIGGSQ